MSRQHPAPVKPSKTISAPRSFVCARRVKRGFHQADNEPDAFEVGDNPDWLVGAY